MAEFSADKVPSLMPVRLSERTSKGAEAARKAGSPERGGQKRLGRVKPQGQGQQQQVGRPTPEQDPNQPQDLGYVQLALQHFNMKGLGRAVPYGVWATLTGNYRQYGQPGHPPFDIFEDA